MQVRITPEVSGDDALLGKTIIIWELNGIPKNHCRLQDILWQLQNIQKQAEKGPIPTPGFCMDEIHTEPIGLLCRFARWMSELGIFTVWRKASTFITFNCIGITVRYIMHANVNWVEWILFDVQSSTTKQTSMTNGPAVSKSTSVNDSLKSRRPNSEVPPHGAASSFICSCCLFWKAHIKSETMSQRSQACSIRTQCVGLYTFRWILLLLSTGTSSVGASVLCACLTNDVFSFV